MPFLTSVYVPPLRADCATPSTYRDLRIQHYSNSHRFEKFLSDIFTLAEKGATSKQIRNKIDSYAQIHSLRCQKCNSPQPCYTLSDILAIDEILFLEIDI